MLYINKNTPYATTTVALPLRKKGELAETKLINFSKTPSFFKGEKYQLCKEEDLKSLTDWQQLNPATLT